MNTQINREEKIKEAEDNFRRASVKLFSGQLSNQGMEQDYSRSYQTLVKLGVRMQIRRKYRGS